MGNLSKGSPANITVIDQKDKLATYTIVNGRVAAFEGRMVRSGYGAGIWVSKFGAAETLGVGQLSMFSGLD
jgi:isoaspartyl peptidase/L-asparaginase-like protein (Ntn-hydrolase superfamily)